MAKRVKIERAEPWRCLLCGKAVSQPTLLGVGDRAQVVHEFVGALHFYMPGNWGSALWDPPPTGFAQARLEGAICDGCLTPHLRRVRVVRVREEHLNVYSEPYPVWERGQRGLRRERIKAQKREEAGCRKTKGS